ncbi:MAG: LysR family transcriptional regulator [Alphaproteobacteria bacterium]|nr:LysR family transcriptional regulator [Alphaproteobacteria bacterium]MDX5369670.1 LysR family transcriptional regulator [Alphaproteobacteria bacterium]MDX5464305.1 LysR family transcriptional regulator [Alphaproteobacteria bacterium]
MPVEHISDLVLFTRVVERGSLSDAGRELGFSPASVSKRLARLEETLGVRLLNRTTRRVSPTDEGHAFYERAVRIVTDVQEAEAAATQSSADPHGLLKVTMPAGFGRLHISPLLPEFMKRYPRVQLDAMLTDSLSDIVGEGIDVALRIAELKDSTLVARKLADNKREIVAAPEFVARHGMPKAPRDLADFDCIVLHGQDHWRFEGQQGQEIVKVTGRYTTNNGDVVRDAVLAGLGIAMKSSWDVDRDIRAGALVRLLPDYRVNPGVAIYAVYPSARHLSARTRAFVDFIVEKFTPRPPWEQV